MATFDRLGIPTEIELDGILAAAEHVLPMITRLPWMDRPSIIQGYASVYSSFLLHAERAAQRYGVGSHEILRRAGTAGYVGGQEDLMIEIAIEIAAARGSVPAHSDQAAPA